MKRIQCGFTCLKHLSLIWKVYVWSKKISHSYLFLFIKYWYKICFYVDWFEEDSTLLFLSRTNIKKTIQNDMSLKTGWPWPHAFISIPEVSVFKCSRLLMFSFKKYLMKICSLWSIAFCKILMSAYKWVFVKSHCVNKYIKN